MTSESGHPRDAIEETAATWIARRDQGGWSDADAAALDAWLAESAGHRVAYYRLAAAWDRVPEVAAVATPRAARGAHRFRLVAVAATLLLLVAAGLLWLPRGTQFRSVPDHDAAPPTAARISEAPAADVAAVAAIPPDDSPPEREALPETVAQTPPAPPQRHATSIGASRTLPLQDGSRATLDTDSEIQVSFDERARTVVLDRGQVFLEVAHDPGRPFIVRAGKLSVVAVGTAFSVRRTGADVRVVVAEGTVRLDDERLLPAGGIARAEDGAVHVEQVAAAEVQRNLSWRSGVLTFRHTPLSAAVAEFNRYVTRKLVIRDSAIATLVLGGVFRPTDSEAFAHLLERTLPIDAAIHPDRIELTARSSP